MQTVEVLRTHAAATFLLAAGICLLQACSPDTANTAENAAEAESFRNDTLTSGLVHPWGMAFLPDGRLLVTERPGRLRILDTANNLSEPISGTPEVFNEGQGGLLDVALAPDFESSGAVYLSFAEPGEGGASTALGRGVLTEGRLDGFQAIFRQEPKVGGENHFGGRIVFAPDGNLFLTLGERFLFDPAQDLSNHLGTIVRIAPDGSAPSDNPFVGEESARDEIWSYGHRNIEAAALSPDGATLWVVEMGPEGGDELNVAEAGRNYGWPVVSWGQNYDGTDIPDPPTRPEFADAVHHWTPVISPSGMLYYDGEALGDWTNSYLIGGLSSEGLVQLKIDGRSVVEEKRIPLGERIRDVEQGPDGEIYVITDEDDGKILRLSPAVGTS